MSGTIDAKLASDHKALELYNLFHSSWSVDYHDDTLSHGFELERSVPLPDALLDAHARSEATVFSGLLPAISRAWVALDERLFLWNYDDARDFCVYDAGEQLIVAVGLVRAPPALFVADVRHLLLVATPTDVTVLGVSFAHGVVNGELSLHPTGLAVPADGVRVLDIAGAADGRAFLAGADGALYELAYAADDSWLAQRPLKCRKLNRSASLLQAIVPSFVRHLYAPDDPLVQLVTDHSRGLLYTLSAASRIEVRVVGVPQSAATAATSSAAAAAAAGASAASAALTGDGARGSVASDSKSLQRIEAQAAAVTCVAALDARQWRRKLATMCPRASDDDKRIVSLHAVPLNESGHVHLVAVTERGSRLYFTTHAMHSWTGADEGVHDPPKTLELLHVRLAPPNTSHDPAALQAGGLLRVAYCSASAFALPLRRAEDRDTLLLAERLPLHSESGSDASDTSTTANSSGRLPFRECGVEQALNSRVFALAAEPAPPVADAYLAATSHVATIDALARGNERGAQAAYDRWCTLASSALGDAPTGVPVGSALARHSYATAHLLPPKRLLCLRGSGLSVYKQKRPLDRLRELLSATRGDDSRDLRQFFSEHGQTEACAMCFVLATSPPPNGGRVGLRAAGAPPSLLQNADPSAVLDTRSSTSVALEHAAINALGRLGGAAKKHNGGSTGSAGGSGVNGHSSSSSNRASQMGDAALGRAVVTQHVAYSGAHDGFALYMARLLRPVWHHVIAVPRAATVAAHSNPLTLGDALCEAADSLDRSVPLVSRLDGEAIALVEQPLEKLYDLVVANPNLCGTGRGAAARAEAQSFAQLRTLLAASLDALSFWRTLCENDFGELARRLSPAGRTELTTTRFRDLVAVASGSRASEQQAQASQQRRDGSDSAQQSNARASPAHGAFAFDDSDGVAQRGQVARLLLNELIALHAERGANVDALSSQLRERCASLFAEADRVRFKAHELLQRARNTGDERERLATLQRAVDHFCSVAANVNVPAVCKALCALDCHTGALELVLAYALAIDPNRVALAFHQSGGPSIGDFGRANNDYWQTPLRAGGGGAARDAGYFDDASVLHESVLAAYACIFDEAEELVKKRASGDRSEAEHARRAFDAFKRAAAQSDDELFHICLYRWFLEGGSGASGDAATADQRATMEDELLQLHTPYLERFLKLHSIDLLCRFYVRNGRMQPAAVILAKRAEESSGDMTLERRIECLSRARGCLAQAVGVQSDATLSLHVHEKLEVARLQLRVRDRLRDVKRAADDDVGADNNSDAADSRQRSAVTSALRELDERLFTVSDLYNRFAKPFRLHEEQLALLHCAGHTDRAVAQRVWEKLLRSYARVDSPSVIGAKIASLGRDYYPSDVTFPVSFIALQLERLSLAHQVRGAQVLWVVHALHSAGVSHAALFGVYDELLARSESDGTLMAVRGLQVHLLRVMASLLDEWLSEQADPRRTLARYRIGVDKYIIALRSASPTELQAAGLGEIERGGLLADLQSFAR